MTSLLQLRAPVTTAVRRYAVGKAGQPLFIHDVIKRYGHTVRLIAVKDLPHGKAYQGDVVHVKAGYARNFLVPKKMAVYATPQNFEKLGLVDPQIETEEQRMARLEREASFDKKADQYSKEADLLRYYLRNKVVSEDLVCRAAFITEFEVAD